MAETSNQNNEGNNQESNQEFDPSQFISKTDHQNELNRLLAEDRRKNQREAEKLRDTHAAMKEQLEGLLQGKSIDELREQIEQTQSKLRSAEDQAKIEAGRYQKKLKDAEDRALSNEQRLRNHLVQRTLLDAALMDDKASTPASADLIVQILEKSSTIDLDSGEVSVELMVEEEGIRTKKKMSPKQAVEWLEAQPSKYGPLFKSTVSGGAGGSTDGLKRKGGGLDVSSMTMEQYATRRKEVGAQTLLTELT
jgi:hypothetical protein